LLDEVGDDIQQQNLIAQWFEVRSAIASWMRMLPSLQDDRTGGNAEGRIAAVALASSNENRARLLKDRLKWFFETHGLKTIETPATSYSWLRMAARHL